MDVPATRKTCPTSTTSYTDGQYPTRNFPEKLIILAVVGAHSGETRSGDKDTIRELNKIEPYLRGTIRMPEIAAILRFADELAEGPQRTSEYLRRIHHFDITVETFHDYSSITTVTIDKSSERIALTYNINMSTVDGELSGAELDRIRRLIEFAYFRIVKLDEERKYAKYYSANLNAFARTSATFHFWIDSQPVHPRLIPTGIG